MNMVADKLYHVCPTGIFTEIIKNATESKQTNNVTNVEVVVVVVVIVFVL